MRSRGSIGGIEHHVQNQSGGERDQEKIIARANPMGAVGRTSQMPTIPIVDDEIAVGRRIEAFAAYPDMAGRKAHELMALETLMAVETGRTERPGVERVGARSAACEKGRGENS